MCRVTLRCGQNSLPTDSGKQLGANSLLCRGLQRIERELRRVGEESTVLAQIDGPAVCRGRLGIDTTVGRGYAV